MTSKQSWFIRKFSDKKIGQDIFEKILFVTYFSLFIVELLSIKSNFFGRIGVYLWFLSWLMVIFYVFEASFFLLRNRKVLVFVLGFCLIVLINTVNPVNLSGETTQQIAGTLNYFKESKDLGFRQNIMFGYPARQFFLPAIFSLIFGRNQFFLNFGASLYYILALVIFSKGLLDYFSDKKEQQLLTIIILSFIPHFYWVNHFIFFYEQSSFPFIFGLMLVGLFLTYISNNSRKYLILMGLVLNYLIFSYTPSLALVIFALFISSYLLIKKRKNLVNFQLISLIIFISVVFLFSSFSFRRDVNLFGEQMNGEYLFNNLRIGFRHLIFLDQGKPMVSPVFQSLFLLTIFYSILNIRDIEIFFSGWWILVTMILSIISKGYTYYGIDFRLHRASIIFPVLLLVIARIFKKLKFDFKRFYLLLTINFFILTGFFFQFNYLNSKESVRHLIFINWLNEKIKEGKLTNKEELIFSDSFKVEYISLHDSLQYFLPDFKYGFISDYLSNSIYPQNGVFFITDEDLFNNSFRSLIIKKQKIGEFSFEEDKILLVLK